MKQQMLKKIRQLFLIISTLFLLNACSIDMDGDLYIGDIIDIADNGQQLFSPMDISFQMSSEDSCEQDKNKISNILNKYFSNFNAKECYSKDFSSYLKTGIDIPIILDTDQDGRVLNSNNDLVSITVIRREDNSSIIDVYLSLNKMMFNALNNELNEVFYQTITLDEVKIKLSINNDGKNTESVSFVSAFINGDPVVAYSTFDIKRRQKIDYLGSNVTSSFFDKYGYTLIMSVGIN